jgi:hypothetical protein
MISSHEATWTTLQRWRTDGTLLDVYLVDDLGVSFSGKGTVLEAFDNGVAIGSRPPSLLNPSDRWRVEVRFRDGGTAEQSILDAVQGSLVVTLSLGPPEGHEKKLLTLVLTGPDPSFSLGRL